MNARGRAASDRRVFVWLHFFEPHEPYDPHAGFDFGPRAVDRYDGEIAYVDHHVGRLLAHIRKAMPGTFVALTADHGEEFGEHGGHYHGNALYDQQVGVPLIVSGPGIKAGRVRGAAQIIDLPTTLLSLVDVPVAAGMRGTDLGPWLAGEDPARLPPVFSEMERKKLVVHRGHKLLCDTARDFCELYDLRRDPGETQNLIGRRPELVADLRGKLDAWLASHVPRRKDEDQQTDVAVLLDRGRQKDPGAVPGLLKLAAGELETRREAVKLLALMRVGAARDTLLRGMRDADPAVRMQATVGAALLGNSAALGQLAAILRRPDLPPVLRRDALLAQARAGQHAATLGLSDYLAHSEDIYERIEIIEALGQLGDQAAAAALRGQLATLRTRLYAIEALGRVRASVAVPDLLQALRRDTFISWRKAAARALGLIGDVRAAPALRDSAARELESDVVGEALVALSRLAALPVPGARTLTPGDWRCAAGVCTCELGASCESLEGSDLLLVADPEAKAHTPARLLCGTSVVVPSVLTHDFATAVALPRGSSGPLRLQPVGGVRPVLRYVAVRPLPTKPAVEPEKPEEKQARQGKGKKQEAEEEEW